MARISEQAKLAYFAGLVDGEGSIGISRESKTGNTFVRLIVAGTDPQLAVWLLSNFGGNVTWKPRQKKEWKPEFIWRVTHGSAIELISQIEPMLIIKWPQAFLSLCHKALRDQAHIVSRGYRKGWRYDDETNDGLQFIADAMKRFNQRGSEAEDPWIFINKNTVQPELFV